MKTTASHLVYRFFVISILTLAFAQIPLQALRAPQIPQPEEKIAQSLLIGSIQFPKTLKTMTSLRIYAGGYKLTGEVDEELKRIMFMIPQEKKTAIVYMLITPDPDFSMENNVIAKLKVRSSSPHKFLKLELIAKDKDNAKAGNEWRITEVSLKADGTIPDNAIIVCYNPERIDRLEGGNDIELPRIHIRDDVAQEELHDEAVVALLSSIKADTVHASVGQKVTRSHHLKNIVTLTT